MEQIHSRQIQIPNFLYFETAGKNDCLPHVIDFQVSFSCIVGIIYITNIELLLWNMLLNEFACTFNAGILMNNLLYRGYYTLNVSIFNASPK